MIIITSFISILPVPRYAKQYPNPLAAHAAKHLDYRPQNPQMRALYLHTF